MTRLEFIEKHRHQLSGWICDAAIRARTGGELAFFLRDMMRRVDSELGEMYDELAEPKQAKLPYTNGVRTGT